MASRTPKASDGSNSCHRPSTNWCSTSDTEIALLACRQHGIFTRSQALNAGASSAQVQRRVRSGSWVKLARGVYGLPGAPPTWRRHILMSCFAAGADAVVSHRSAAVLHGFAGFRPGVPELSVPHGSTPSSNNRVHQVVSLLESERGRLDGIPTTTKLRTVFDLASVTNAERLGTTIDDLVVGRVIRLEDLLAGFDRYARRGRPGVAVLRAVVEQRGPGYVPPESVLEAKLLEVVAVGGLPVPVRQHRLSWLAAGDGRVDFAYPAARLIVEVDSRRWHTRMKDFEDDERRDLEALANGWRTARVSWTALQNEPTWVCSRITAALTQVTEEGAA